MWKDLITLEVTLTHYEDTSLISRFCISNSFKEYDVLIVQWLETRMLHSSYQTFEDRVDWITILQHFNFTPFLLSEIDKCRTPQTTRLE